MCFSVAFIQQFGMFHQDRFQNTPSPQLSHLTSSSQAVQAKGFPAHSPFIASRCW